eukprot:scaffold1543_cov128-Skeletonema_menzelii.AAC.6
MDFNGWLSEWREASYTTNKSPWPWWLQAAGHSLARTQEAQPKVNVGISSCHPEYSANDYHEPSTGQHRRCDAPSNLTTARW